MAPRDALAAEIVIESNGGTRRVPVRLGRPERPPAIPDAAAPGPVTTISDLVLPAVRRIGRLSPPVRLGAGIAVAVLLRTLVLASGLVPAGGRGVPLVEPRLPALAILGAAIGATLGLLAGWRRREGGPLDVAGMGLASGLLGVLAAAVLHAVVKTVERPLGDWSSSLWAVVLLWGLVGAAVAGASLLVVPHRDPSKGAST